MSEKQTIEELQQRYSEFHDQKIQIQTQQAAAQKRLADLKKQAKKSFGTDDIEALCEKLSAMKKENEQKRAKYQKDLDKLEAELESVQAEYAEVEIDD